MKRRDRTIEMIIIAALAAVAAVLAVFFLHERKTQGSSVEVQSEQETGEAQPEEAVPQEPVEPSPLILIGDSRTVGMYQAVSGDLDQDEIHLRDDAGRLWSAKVGIGLDWMEETGVPAVEDEITDGSQVVVLMGVNDIMGVPSPADYCDYLNPKAREWVQKGASVWYVSVNPIRQDLDNGLTNDLITYWNERMISALSSDITYIDTNTQIIDHIEYADDLHYEFSTSLEILSLVEEQTEVQ